VNVRSQLILAFLILAVVPLAGIVSYSYLTSQESFRRAVEVEARGLAEEMSERLETVREDLRSHLDSVARLPAQPLLPSGLESGEATEVYADLMAQMGELASLADWLEFVPAPADSTGSAAVEPFFIYPSKTLAETLGRLGRGELSLEESGLTQEYLDQAVRQAILQSKRLKAGELEALQARGEEARELLGSEFTSPVLRGSHLLGYLTALVPPSHLLRQVLSRTPRDSGEVPYARDEEGGIYVDRREDKKTLAEIGVEATGTSPDTAENWIVVETPDPESGLIFGVARPTRESLKDFRQTAVRNFSYGLGIMVLAMAGIVWLSARMTRDLSALTVGAQRLAQGDLTTRVPVRSKDEFGRLALNFNRMAQELSYNQEQLLQEERRRKEQEIQRRLLEAENDRKSRELEEARQFQLSLLPKALPASALFEVAVFMKTAAEVGGDYYDFFAAGDGRLTAAIGDAAGHGARAGIMVTVVKGLLTARAADGHPREVLEEATRAIKQMDLGRMNMALSLARLSGNRVLLSSAGMPPALVYRRERREVEEVALRGTPLGSIAQAEYEEWESDLAPGDTLLFMTDGFPELLNGDGEPLGYSRVRSLFEGMAAGAPKEIIQRLSTEAASWNGGRQLEDDITFVVFQHRSSGVART
jgi:serine phosphatase RsbU (regulator of sigma subunit)